MLSSHIGHTLSDDSALTGFTLSITGHLMTVIKVDGGNDVFGAPTVNSIGILYPGERVDIIVQKLSSINSEHPQLTIGLDKENLKFKNFALTPTQHFPIATGPYTRTPDPPLPLRYNLAKATSPETEIATDLATVATQTILLYTKVEILAEYSNIPKGFINRTSWAEPDSSTPPLLETDRKDWKNHFIPRIQASNDTWVDIVLNNIDEKGHPFHLVFPTSLLLLFLPRSLTPTINPTDHPQHGTPFHILTTHRSPPGHHKPYNPYIDPLPPINTLNPIKKDTVYVPGSGYVILRFRPDNPGLWLCHCHVLWHHAVGMGMAFEIDDFASSGNGTQIDTPPTT